MKNIDLVSPYTLPAIGHNLSASAHFILYSDVLAGASKLHAKTHELDAANACLVQRYSYDVQLHNEYLQNYIISIGWMHKLMYLTTASCFLL